MSANAPEWIMAVASVGTGVFIGVQSWLMRSSIEVAQEASLVAQEASLVDRKLEVCETYLMETSRYLPYLAAFSGTENSLDLLLMVAGDEAETEQRLRQAEEFGWSAWDAAVLKPISLSYIEYSKGDLEGLLGSLNRVQFFVPDEQVGGLSKAQEDIVAIDMIARYSFEQATRADSENVTITQKTAEQIANRASDVQTLLAEVAGDCRGYFFDRKAEVQR